MKYFLITLYLGLYASNIYAIDSPPCWCESKTFSPNEIYFAWIKEIKKDTITPRYRNDWKLMVYQKKDNDSTLIWEIPYNYDGYPGGFLSNDGKYFTDISYWYYPKYLNSSLVKIYDKSGKIIHIKQRAFKIRHRKLKKTVSHWLWLEEGDWEKNKNYQEPIQYTDNEIFIYTVNQERFLIRIKERVMINLTKNKVIPLKSNN